MDYIAHIRESDKEIQTVEQHLTSVRELAEKNGEKLGIPHVAGLAGLLHDMGKFTEAFREYIWNAVFHPEKPVKRGSVDHSTAGGKLLYERYHTGAPKASRWLVAEIVGNAIISHHAYLQDMLAPDMESGYLRRVHADNAVKLDYDKACANFFEHVMSEKKLDAYVDLAATELEAFLAQKSDEATEGRLSLLTKFVFSILIDADRTDSREFEENCEIQPYKEAEQVNEAHANVNLWEDYDAKLMAHLHRLRQRPGADSTINRLRREMSERCESQADRERGIYTLSIPTGGGKTLASFRFALKHARKHNLKRIIYVIPFTTIIEQNAQELRDIIHDDTNLLEHHSTVVNDIEDDATDTDEPMTTAQKLKLARDNWDSPIVMTTMVQFLNAWYAKGSRYIRRLHNLSEAVIIFDEVQKVPVHCVSLFNSALNFLVQSAGSSVVLCTATQPALDSVRQRLTLADNPEIIEHPLEVAKAFERVEMCDKTQDGPMDPEQVAMFVHQRLDKVGSVLVILNTKSVVRRTFEALIEQRTDDKEYYLFHLSTGMCAAHRKEKLKEIRELLKRKERVVCVSTQLIEAGVDISFQCVIRSLSGIDSIAQAAGRCNRHGEFGMSTAYLIEVEGENTSGLKEIHKGKELTLDVLINLRQDALMHDGHLLSLDAIRWYYERFYHEFKEELDYPVLQSNRDMMTLLMLNAHQEKKSCRYEYKQSNRPKLDLYMTSSFLTAAEHFEVIRDQTTSVIAPYGEEGRDLIARLNGGGSIAELSQALREAQSYTVNVFQPELKALDRNGGIYPLLDGKMLALRENAYDDQYGLNINSDGALGLAMF
ncbi:CRISPR-associated helicase Cas3' [Paenibacillus sp. HB172176]|uniref:CRISPR-associated helicase Cas3' n=1 Tax=Paenibacillus sp. HB172176 TaxID=2493690 RepID=UPI00143BEFFD|nr:CRISPR-associated helicase Cas3' [Paenibacillus sp. HB172176]